MYGSASIPAGAAIHSGYLARPDGVGAWPTVLVFGPEPIPTSTVKNICRSLARHGVAALAPELTVDHEANRRITSQVVAFMTDPTGAWSNSEFGYGALAIGTGIYDAAALGAVDGHLVALAAIATTFDDIATEHLAAADIPALFIGSREDQTCNVEASLAVRDTVPRTTFVVYPAAPEGWWSDAAKGFDASLASDTFERVITFLSDELPPRV